MEYKDIMVFDDGDVNTNFVGKIKEFKDKDEFLKSCKIQYDYLIKDKKITIEDVYKSYVRYYPKVPDYTDCECTSGYTFSKKGRGAFEVYVIDLRGE